MAHAHRPRSALSKEDSGWEFKKGGGGALGGPSTRIVRGSCAPGQGQKVLRGMKGGWCCERCS